MNASKRKSTQIEYYAPPYQKHSDTSEAAALEIELKAGTLRHMLYQWLLNNGLATDEAQQDGTGMNPSTQRPRRVELVEMGLVVDSGLRGTTRSGRSAVLWRAIEQAREPVQELLF